MRSPLRSLRRRVVIAAAASTALVMTGAGVVVVDRVAAREDRLLDELVHTNWELEVVDHANRGTEAFEALDYTAYIGIRHGGPGAFQRVFVDGRLAAVTGEVPGGAGTAFPSSTVARFPGDDGYETVTFEGHRYRVYAQEAFYWKEKEPPVVQAAVRTSDRDAAVGKVRFAAAGIGAGGTGLAALLALMLAGRGLRPLERLRTAASGVSTTDDLERRVPQDAGIAEIDGLGASINQMLERLEDSVRRQDAALEATRRLTADAGHELRTPLTSLSANVSTLIRNPDLSEAERARVLTEAGEDMERLTGLLEQLQLLARGDARVGERHEVLDLTEIADAVVLDARRRHPGARITLGAPERGVPVIGSTEGLRTLLANLVTNAALHAGPAPGIEVEVLLRRFDVLVTVDDDGPGIPRGDRGRIFERFARGAGSQNVEGSGLGLAIAAQEAELHGGSITVADAPGGGARFILTLPLARD